ncbi:hypothetical protein LARI1_G009281 [Lachnellula arida]|uniref:DUF3295 domain-containing protein n=1 Tax=Lachnellula arida TaxID=1316785 RepID=A0A8T9BDM4_9HELO|nr:hypothetical protein LARI1_G009281 [Lachnellula arida]
MPDDLKKMVLGIKEQKNIELLFISSTSLLITPASISEVDVAAITATNPVRGPQPKQQTVFALGGSTGEDSMSEQNSSLENSLQLILKPKKKSAILSFSRSSNEDESSLPAKIKSQSGLTNDLQRPQQTSFKEEVATRTIQEEQPFDNDVFETEEDDIDESAIDDDASSDWEELVEGSGNASIDERTFFQCVDSKANLTSRRSLITTMVHQSDRANALAQAAAATTSRSTPALQRSRKTSPISPSTALSPNANDASRLIIKRGLKPIAEVPQAVRTSAQPIIHTTINITPLQQALLPQKIIYDELTVRLRQHLIHEHGQKSQTANAVFKRRHTTHDVANLKQYPEKVHMESKEGDAVDEIWDDSFGNCYGYHWRGW